MLFAGSDGCIGELGRLESGDMAEVYKERIIGLLKHADYQPVRLGQLAKAMDDLFGALTGHDPREAHGTLSVKEQHDHGPKAKKRMAIVGV